jgi:uncharacterized protein (DUF58 family)
MLPETLMRDLRYIEVITSRKMRNLRAGTYTSRMRGSGFDFDEHRPYRPGDDVRRIDWNVTARLQQPFVRETHAERELNLLVAVDLSRSMAVGTTRYDKKELALFIAACLLFSAVADQINIGLLAFADRVIGYWPPKRARARAWSILEELWNLDLQPGRTKLLPVADHLQKHLRHASMVFLVSDFLTHDEFVGATGFKVLTSVHDVVAVIVEDPTEVALLPGSAAVRLRDPETGRGFRMGLSSAAREEYLGITKRRRDALVKSFYNVGIDHAVIRADASVVEPLFRVFATRRRA